MVDPKREKSLPFDRIETEVMVQLTSYVAQQLYVPRTGSLDSGNSNAPTPNQESNHINLMCRCYSTSRDLEAGEV